MVFLVCNTSCSPSPLEAPIRTLLPECAGLPSWWRIPPVLCHNDLAIAEHELWGSMNGDTFQHIEVSAMLTVLLRHSANIYRIPHDDISITALGNATFPWE